MVTLRNRPFRRTCGVLPRTIHIYTAGDHPGIRQEYRIHDVNRGHDPSVFPLLTSLV